MTNMNIDRVKKVLTLEERVQAAAAIREVLDKQRYIGWTGKPNTDHESMYMC